MRRDLRTSLKCDKRARHRMVVVHTGLEITNKVELEGWDNVSPLVAVGFTFFVRFQGSVTTMAIA